MESSQKNTIDRIEGVMDDAAARLRGKKDKSLLLDKERVMLYSLQDNGGDENVIPLADLTDPLDPYAFNGDSSPQVFKEIYDYDNNDDKTVSYAWFRLNKLLPGPKVKSHRMRACNSDQWGQTEEDRGQDQCRRFAYHDEMTRCEVTLAFNLLKGCESKRADWSEEGLSYLYSVFSTARTKFQPNADCQDKCNTEAPEIAEGGVNKDECGKQLTEMDFRHLIKPLQIGKSILRGQGSEHDSLKLAMISGSPFQEKNWDEFYERSDIDDRIEETRSKHPEVYPKEMELRIEERDQEKEEDNEGKIESKRKPIDEAFREVYYKSEICKFGLNQGSEMRFDLMQLLPPEILLHDKFFSRRRSNPVMRLLWLSMQQQENQKLRSMVKSTADHGDLENQFDLDFAYGLDGIMGEKCRCDCTPTDTAQEDAECVQDAPPFQCAQRNEGGHCPEQYSLCPCNPALTEDDFIAAYHFAPKLVDGVDHSEIRNVYRRLKHFTKRIPLMLQDHEKQNDECIDVDYEIPKWKKGEAEEAQFDLDMTDESSLEETLDGNVGKDTLEPILDEGYFGEDESDVREMGWFVYYIIMRDYNLNSDMHGSVAKVCTTKDGPLQKHSAWATVKVSSANCGAAPTRDVLRVFKDMQEQVRFCKTPPANGEPKRCTPDSLRTTLPDFKVAEFPCDNHPSVLELQQCEQKLKDTINARISPDFNVGKVCAYLFAQTSGYKYSVADGDSPPEILFPDEGGPEEDGFVAIRPERQCMIDTRNRFQKLVCKVVDPESGLHDTGDSKTLCSYTKNGDGWKTCRRFKKSLGSKFAAECPNGLVQDPSLYCEGDKCKQKCCEESSSYWKDAVDESNKNCKFVLDECKLRSSIRKEGNINSWCTRLAQKCFRALKRCQCTRFNKALDSSDLDGEGKSRDVMDLKKEYDWYFEKAKISAWQGEVPWKYNAIANTDDDRIKDYGAKMNNRWKEETAAGSEAKCNQRPGKVAKGMEEEDVGLLEYSSGLDGPGNKARQLKRSVGGAVQNDMLEFAHDLERDFSQNAGGSLPKQTSLSCRDNHRMPPHKWVNLYFFGSGLSISPQPIPPCPRDMFVKDPKLPHCCPYRPCPPKPVYTNALLSGISGGFSELMDPIGLVPIPTGSEDIPDLGDVLQLPIIQPMQGPTHEPPMVPKLFRVMEDPVLGGVHLGPPTLYFPDDGEFEPAVDYEPLVRLLSKARLRNPKAHAEPPPPFLPPRRTIRLQSAVLPPLLPPAAIVRPDLPLMVDSLYWPTTFNLWPMEPPKTENDHHPALASTQGMLAH